MNLEKIKLKLAKFMLLIKFVINYHESIVKQYFSLHSHHNSVFFSRKEGRQERKRKRKKGWREREKKRK